jgi:hypothetical protein
MPRFEFQPDSINGGRDGDVPSAEHVKISGPNFSSPLKPNGSSAGAPSFATVYVSRELPRPAGENANGDLKLLQVADKARGWTNQRGQDSNWSKLKLQYDQLDQNNKCEDLQVISLERVVVTDWSLSWSQGSPRGVIEQVGVRAYKVTKDVDGTKAILILDAVESR